jgi:hypothetical protein
MNVEVKQVAFEGHPSSVPQPRVMYELVIIRIRLKTLQPAEYKPVVVGRVRDSLPMASAAPDVAASRISAHGTSKSSLMVFVSPFFSRSSIEDHTRLKWHLGFRMHHGEPVGYMECYDLVGFLTTRRW